MTLATEMSRAEWLAWRRERVTASDVARWTTGYYGGALAVIEEKIAPSDDEPTAAMLRGLAAEDAICGAVEAMTGMVVVNRQRLAESADGQPFAATLDGELAPSLDAAPVAVLESKTSGQFVRAPHAYFAAQVNWQLLVTGHTVGLIARGDYHENENGDELLVGIRLSRVVADPRLQAELVEAADRILGHVATGTMPAPDGSKYASKYLGARYRAADFDVDAVQLDDDVEALLDERDELLVDVEPMTARIAEIENQVKALLGASTTGVGSRWRTVWQGRRSLDVDAMRADAALAPVVLAHTTVSASVDATGLAKALGKKTATKFRTIPAGRGALTITPIKEK